MLTRSFQTTYEELKHKPEQHLDCTEHPGFQTTYEELKPVSLTRSASPLGFQTTYEELKPS